MAVIRIFMAITTVTIVNSNSDDNSGNFQLTITRVTILETVVILKAADGIRHHRTIANALPQRAFPYTRVRGVIHYRVLLLGAQLFGAHEIDDIQYLLE